MNDTDQDQEQAQESASADVSATKSTKVGDKVVASPINDSKRGRRNPPKAYRMAGPAKWATAKLMFTRGELTSYKAVAEYLGCGLNTVTTRAAREKWSEARAIAVKAILAKVGECDGMAVVKSAESLASLAANQASLADWAMGHGRLMAKQAEDVLLVVHSSALRLAEASPSHLDPEQSRRLTALASVHAGLVETIRVLAGLPHPDKVPRPRPSKPQHSAQDAPRTARKGGMLGLDPSNQSAAVGGKEEGGGGVVGPVVAMPTPPPQSEGGAVSGGGPLPERVVHVQSSDVPVRSKSFGSWGGSGVVAGVGVGGGSEAGGSSSGGPIPERAQFQPLAGHAPSHWSGAVPVPPVA